jgi:hypothetical protein
VIPTGAWAGAGCADVLLLLLLALDLRGSLRLPVGRWWLREANGGVREGEGGGGAAAVGAEQVHGVLVLRCHGGRLGGGAVRPGQWGCRQFKQPPRRQEEACTFPTPSPHGATKRCFLNNALLPVWLTVRNCHFD